MREVGGRSHKAGDTKLTSDKKIRVGYLLSVNGHRGYYHVIGKGSAIITPPLQRDLDGNEQMTKYSLQKVRKVAVLNNKVLRCS